MRQTFDLYVSHEAENNNRVRDLIARQSEEFHRELLEVVRVTSEIRGRTKMQREAAEGPHPMGRAEDYEQRVILQLSRKDLWKVLGAGALLIMLVIGLALVAGREGLSIWGKAAAPVIPTIPGTTR